MYIESKPAQIHLQEQMSPASEHHIPRLRRPPAVLQQSSSSSIRGMERTAPSFQAFITKNAPVETEKPLPPVPYNGERPNSQSASPRSRRSSSIYSRTVSQWVPSTDMFLQPSAYSLSTPELTTDAIQERQHTGTLLQPRAYEPLLRSPTPSSVDTLSTVSKETSLEELYNERHDHVSFLLPPAEIPALLSPHRIRTVSLDKARAAAHSSNTNFHRDKAFARSLHKSCSLKGLSAMSIAAAIPLLPSSPLYKPSYEQSQTYDEDAYSARYSAPAFPWSRQSILKFDPRDSKIADSYFGLDAVSRAAVAPAAKQQFRRSSTIVGVRTSEKEVSAEDDNEEDDGKDGEQESLRDHLFAKPHEVCVAKQEPRTLMDQINNTNLIDEADRLAQEYHNLLPPQPGQRSHKGMRTSFDGRDVRLAPQPLFFNPRQVSKQRIEEYTRLRNASAFVSDPLEREIRRPVPAERRRNDSPAGVLPLKLSLTPDSTRSEGTSGSIPISPHASTKNNTESKQLTLRDKPSIMKVVVTTGSPKQRKLSIPHSDHRIVDLAKGVDPKDYSNHKKTITADPSPTPRVGAMIVATRAEAEAAFNTISIPSNIPRTINHKHKDSDDSGADSQLTTNNPLAQVGEKVASLTSVLHRVPGKTSQPSGHLWPRLGESSSKEHPRIAKLSISAPIPILPNAGGTRLPAYGIQKEMLKKTPSLVAAQKRPSLFANVVDKQRESKANKRRAELKKSIRLLPSIDGAGLSQQNAGGGGGGAHRWL